MVGCRCFVMHVVRCVLVVRCALCVVRCALRLARCVLVVVCCWLFVVCCWLLVVARSSLLAFVACRSLLVAR